MTQRNWTEDEIKYLRLLRERGLSHQQMADKLNRTTNAVRVRLGKEGLTGWRHYRVAGTIITFEQMRQGEANGLDPGTIKSRVARGVPVEQAITDPIADSHRRKSDVDELTPSEIEMIIGRMKYMNMTEAKDNPFQPTVPMMKKMEQHGIHVDDIKAVEC